MNTQASKRDLAIWGFAFGYFACYAPYSALAKALSEKMLPGQVKAIPGPELLPSTVLASLVSMLVFLTAMGWWKHAGRGKVLGFEVPLPNRYTFISGICSALIILTTTLSYTFKGLSIVFMMLLMRGGVLVIAPMVDFVSKRKVRWFSWAALALALLALFVGFLPSMGEGDGIKLTVVASVNVALYLLSYFVRLRFMSKIAKSEDPKASLRYFVEEHMVSTPMAILILVVMALIGDASTVTAQVRHGFTDFWAMGVVIPAVIVGILSEGTGIFGGLILLEKQENTFCVPVNRASSVLAGLVASYGLHAIFGTRVPVWTELLGAALLVAAIVVLTMPGMLAKLRKA